jgi:hypothetical protein
MRQPTRYAAYAALLNLCFPFRHSHHLDTDSDLIRTDLDAFGGARQGFALHCASQWFCICIINLFSGEIFWGFSGGVSRFGLVISQVFTDNTRFKEGRLL